MKLGIALPALAVVLLYGLAARQASKPEGTYNRMAEAFLAGRVSISKELPSEFLQDPYRFWKNEKFILESGLIDQSLYNGKVYSYFGPVPAVLLYAPCRLLTGRPLPDRAAVLLFAFGAFAWAAALFRKIARRHYPGASGAMTAAVCGVLGLANAAPFLISRSHMYEVAISSGAFFLNGALYFLCGALSEEKGASRRLIAAGVFFGLAAGCRPHLALAASAAMAFGAWALVRAGRPAAWKNLFFPFAALAAALLFYNFARFGDPLEFGTKYQMTPINDRQASVLFDPSRVFANGYVFLFQPPVFTDRFPFVHQGVPSLPAGVRWPAGSFYTQRTVGLLPGVPFMLIFLLAPLAAWFAAPENVRSFFKPAGLPAKAVLAGSAAYLSLIVAADLARQLAADAALTEAAAFLGRCQEEIPFALFLAAAFLVLLWKRTLASDRSFPRAAFGLFLAPGLTAFATVLFFNMHTLRYLGDFATPLLSAGGLLWLHFDRALAGDAVARPALRALGATLALSSMFLGVAYALY